MLSSSNFSSVGTKNASLFSSVILGDAEMDSLEKLKEQTRFFLREAGHCGWPWLRMYLRCFITKALEKHSMEEVNAAIKEAVAETAKELNADPEKWLA